MSLHCAKLTASIAVLDMDRARRFNEGNLGLSSVREQSDGSRIYASGGSNATCSTSTGQTPSAVAAATPPSTTAASPLTPRVVGDTLEQIGASSTSPLSDD
jgi:hypothetical protein